jgi:hypothetical protein
MMAKAEQVGATRKASGTYAAARGRRPQSAREVKGPITIDLLYTCMQEQLREITDLKDSMRSLAMKVNAGVVLKNTGEEVDKFGERSNFSSEKMAVEKFVATEPKPPKRPIQSLASSSGNNAIDNHNQAIERSVTKIAERMFEMMDSNPGVLGPVISLDDALDFVRKSGNNSDFVPTLESLRKTYDVDGNGAIDIDEFTAIVQDIYTAKQKDARDKAKSEGQHGVVTQGVRISDFNFGREAAETEQKKQKEKEDELLRKRKYKCCHFIRAQQAVDPNSSLGFYTTITTMLLLLYGAFLIPARLGFNSEDSAGPLTNFIDYFSEFWFIWDIVVNFHLAYEDPHTGQLIVSLQRIRDQYLHSWLALDCVSSVPIKTITLLAPPVERLSFLRVLKLCKLFRLVKLLKLKALEDMEDSGVVSPSAIRLAKVSLCRQAPFALPR